jgi:hypothetical protein
MSENKGLSGSRRGRRNGLEKKVGEKFILAQYLHVKRKTGRQIKEYGEPYRDD